MKELFWITREAVEAGHDVQLAEHGGSPGLRDEGLLESALAYPRNQFAYGETDLFMLAAAYAFALVRNHAFIDGNKRIGFLSAYLFLEMNGWEFDASEADVVLMTLRLADSTFDQQAYALWLKDNARPY